MSGINKKFETVDVSNLGNLFESYRKQDHIRGEIVVLVGEALSSLEVMSNQEIDEILLELARTHSAAQAAALAAKKTGLKNKNFFSG